MFTLNQLHRKAVDENRDKNIKFIDYTYCVDYIVVMIWFNLHADTQTDRQTDMYRQGVLSSASPSGVSCERACVPLLCARARPQQ